MNSSPYDRHEPPSQIATSKQDSGWLQRVPPLPIGVSLQQHDSHVVVRLARRSFNHWPYWLIIIATTLLMTEPIVSTGFEFNVVGAAAGFAVTTLIYLWAWRSRVRLLLFDDRIVIRRGVGLLGSEVALPYDGLEVDSADDEISLHWFGEDDDKVVAVPASAWLKAFLATALEGRCSTPSSGRSALLGEDRTSDG